MLFGYVRWTVSFRWRWAVVAVGFYLWNALIPSHWLCVDLRGLQGIGGLLWPPPFGATHRRFPSPARFSFLFSCKPDRHLCPILPSRLCLTARLLRWRSRLPTSPIHPPNPSQTIPEASSAHLITFANQLRSAGPREEE